jgi:WD40 repeat protein
MQLFDAFISYSHRSDGLTAPTLQRGLENFNRNWFGHRRLRIFRDQTDLSVTPSLWGIIQEALGRSRFFILLASPEAAHSKWVDREVRQWLETKPANNILLVVTNGGCAWDDTRHDFDRLGSSAIPPALFGAFSEEPLFLDLRNDPLREYRSPKAQEAIATLAAPIHGKSKQELLGLEIQLIRKRLLAASVGLVLIAVLAAGFLWSALEASRQRDEARAQRNQAQSELAAARSTLAFQSRQASPAFWDAVKAWRLDPNWVAQKALYEFARMGLHATLNHGADIFQAAISRDGRYALTAGAFGLKVWKIDGTPVFSAESGAIGDGLADFSADTSRVVFTTASPKVFDISGVRQFDLPAMPMEGNAWFSPDSRYVFTVERGQPSRRWDMAGRQLNEYRHKGDVTCLAAAADSSMVAAGTSGAEVYLWSIEGRALRTFRDSAPITSVEFSPEASRILSVNRNGALTILNTGNDSSRIILDRGAIAAAISPQGNLIGVVGDKTVRLMTFDGVVVRTLKDDDAPEAESHPFDQSSWLVDYRQIGRAGGGALRFVAGGKYIVTSVGGATRVWDIEAGLVRTSLQGKLLAATPDENYLITAGKYSALLWEANNALRSEIPHKIGISAVALAPTGGAIATASFDGKARLWDQDGHLTATVVHGSPLSFVTFSHDGQKLLTVARDGTIRLWSRAGELLKAFRHADVVNHVAFAPDDSQIVIGSLDGTATIQTLRDERVVTLDHNSAVYDAAYSPDGQSLATGAADRLVRVWRVDSGSLRWQTAAPDSVSGLAFSRDGQRIVATTAGNQILVLEAETGRVLTQVKSPDTLIRTELAVNGDLVATSAADRVVRLWDIGGRQLAELTHSEPVGALAVSRDGKRILTGSKDGRARLWDVQGNELFAFPDEDIIQQVAFSTDGNSVVTVSPHRVRIWNFGSPEAIIEHYQDSIGKPPTENDEILKQLVPIVGRGARVLP